MVTVMGDSDEPELDEDEEVDEEEQKKKEAAESKIPENEVKH